MPKLEIRNVNPLFRLNRSDAEKIAAETVRRYRRPATPPVEATQKARNWANTLWGQKQTEQLPQRLQEVGTRLWDGVVYARECSELIEALKLLPYRPRQTQQPAAPASKVGGGWYRLPDGGFVKVQESQSTGRMYAKRWDGAHWVYESGLYNKLAPEMEMSAADAKQFGDLYGHCVYCGRILNDERSITAGYGPTCADNRGLPWG